MNDTQKVIYAKMMMAAGPMFDKLDASQQAQVIERVANDLMKKVHGEVNSKKDNINVSNAE